MLDKAFESLEQTMVKAEISMTPLIDMVFLLLIFFVVTTTFTKETGITVNKARAGTSQMIHRHLMIIALDRDGNYWYDKAKRPIDEITAIARQQKQENADVNIVIIPDKDGRVEPLVAIMDRLRACDITKFSLGTQQADAASGHAP